MATQKSDYYDILGVSKSASNEEIKKAYRKQALEWHPDHHKEDKEAAEKRFKDINEAYQVLSDSQKRSAYDQYGHDAFSHGGMSGGPSGAGTNQSGRYGPFTYTYTTQGEGSPFSGFDFGDPFDIFEQFFGGYSPFRQERRAPRYSLTVDFMDAVRGSVKEVNMNGNPRKIKIPAGVNDGSSIDFNDFILTINVLPDKVFEREDDDIYVRVGIPFSLAVLGGEIEVPTIDGTMKLRVRAATQSGTTIRLKNGGVPHLRGRGKGDEYVRINVVSPEKLTSEQKRIITDLRDLGL